MAEYSGHEVDLYIYLTSYVAIAQVKDIGGPEISADQIEVSHRDSDWRKYVNGMLDGGELTFDIVFDPDHASHDPTLTNSIYAYMVAGTATNFKLEYPGVGSAVTSAIFSGTITNFGLGAPLEDALTASITIKLSGAITWAHVA